ncbi:MAG: response regulator [Pseudomonadota bacterium]
MPDVLIVDDDDIDVMAVQRALAKLERAPRTHVAHDGEEALAILRSVNRGPHALRTPFVVLLDINMPRMNGFEFLDCVRRDDKLRDIVVFMLSTSDAPGDLARAYGYHVAGYINKARASGDFASSMNMLAHYCSVVDLPEAR